MRSLGYFATPNASKRPDYARDIGAVVGAVVFALPCRPLCSVCEICSDGYALMLRSVARPSSDEADRGIEGRESDTSLRVQ